MNNSSSCRTLVKTLKSGTIVLSNVSVANSSPNSTKGVDSSSSSKKSNRRGHNGASPKERDRLSNCLWHLFDTYGSSCMLWIVVDVEPFNKSTGKLCPESLEKIANNIQSVKNKLTYILKKEGLYVYNFGLMENRVKNTGLPVFDLNICKAFGGDAVQIEEQKERGHRIAVDFCRSVNRILPKDSRLDLDVDFHVESVSKRGGGFAAFVKYFSSKQQEPSSINCLKHHGKLGLLPGKYSGISNDLKPYAECEQFEVDIPRSVMAEKFRSFRSVSVDVEESLFYTIIEPRNTEKQSREAMLSFVETFRTA